jgi:Icc-related predicted phosphoesterase
MMQAATVADLHGNLPLYELLLRIANLWKLSSIFIAGDLAPSVVYESEATDHSLSRRSFRF